MDKLAEFCVDIKKIIDNAQSLSISDAREVVKNINDFLYTNYPDIGKTQVLGEYREYFSDFHKFWEMHHKDILGCKIDDKKCELVADSLHSVFINTKGKSFYQLYDTCGLNKKDVCRVRFLTANQDFRGSLDFNKIASIFKSDNSIFDESKIVNDPESFINSIGISGKSQNDKRNGYAKTISEFLISKNCEPFKLIKKYNNNIFNLRNDIIACYGSGYGPKKTDMFLRDMVVLKIWKNVIDFDKIDVASDVNTIKVALRTGIIRTEIPLVSSFLDIFCHQYVHIDTMNARAWRRVWEIWKNKYPSECIESPCLIDYFVYNVIGKQFCKEILYKFECNTHSHTFLWHSARNKTCQVCYKNGANNKAYVIDKMMPCSVNEGYIAIKATDYVRSLKTKQKIDKCPFINICGENRYLQPPKSISIMGQTSWSTAYSRKDKGGGGLMA